MTSPVFHLWTDKRFSALLVIVAMFAGTAPVSGWLLDEDELPAARAQDDRVERGGPESKGPRRGKGQRHEFGPPRGLWNRMEDKERQCMGGFLEEYFPEMYLELERIKDKHPERFMRRMGRLAPEIREVMEMMETHPERASLMIQSRRLHMDMRKLSRRYHATDDEQKRAQLRSEFREACAKALDFRQERRALEIRELEARISELKQRHEAAAKMRDKLIDREVEERLDQAEGMPAGPMRDDLMRPDRRGGRGPRPRD
ncbi:MAG: hypothetical protein JSU63_12155 [Phycisphaerales bacterium]|nr:MAG: hypothetical protein JSU63_12155 [Phycisphaerales bacterium]